MIEILIIIAITVITLVIIICYQRIRMEDLEYKLQQCEWAKQSLQDWITIDHDEKQNYLKDNQK